MKKIIGDFAFFAVLLLIVARFLTIFNGVAFPANIVASSSMKPTLNKGDIVIWIPCKIENVAVGDIVVYRSIYGNLVVHRVVDIKNGKLVTKGDANEYTDQKGPHLPEPYVDEERLKGKVIMIGNSPAKIPYAGYLWILINDAFEKLSKHILWGEPQPKIKFAIFLPFFISISVLMSLIIFWLPNGINVREELQRLIFGAEKLSLKKAFLLFIPVFTSFLLFTSFLSYDSSPVKKEIPISNPSLFPVKGILIIKENGKETFKEFIELKSGEIKRIRLENFSGTAYLYSSPYWFLIPEKFAELKTAQFIIASSVYSAFILTLITLFILTLFSITIDKLEIFLTYLSFIFLQYPVKLKFKNLKWKKIKDRMLWINMFNKKILLTPFLSLIFIPLLFDGVKNLLLVIAISSVFISFIAYAIGCRFKNEIAYISFISSLLISIAFTTGHSQPTDLILLINVLSISLILSIFIFILHFLLSWSIIATIHYLKEKIDCVASLEVCDL